MSKKTQNQNTLPLGEDAQVNVPAETVVTGIEMPVNNPMGIVWHTDSMWTSQYTDKVNNAMVLFNCENITIEKKGEANINAQVKRRYVKLDDILGTVRPVLAKCGLYIEQHLAGDSVITRIVHTSGQFIASKLHYQTWEANQVNNLQKLGGGLTYLKRYAISAILNIVADDDTDGEGNDGIGYKKATPVTYNADNKKAVPVNGNADNNKEWLNMYDKQGNLTTKGKGALEFIKGGGSIDTIKQKYNINKKEMEVLVKSMPVAGQGLEDIYHNQNGEEGHNG